MKRASVNYTDSVEMMRIIFFINRSLRASPSLLNVNAKFRMRLVVILMRCPVRE